jgi:hypothetical protein
MPNYKTIRVRCPDGKVRSGRVGLNVESADLPWACQVQVKGVSVSGQAVEDRVDYFTFLVHPSSANAGVFSKEYKTRRGWLKNPIEFVPGPPKTALREVLTLADIQDAEGEITLTREEVDSLAGAFRQFSEPQGWPLLRTQSLCRALRVLPKANQHYMLPKVKVRPHISIELTGNWKEEMHDLTMYLMSLT